MSAETPLMDDLPPTQKLQRASPSSCPTPEQAACRERPSLFPTHVSAPRWSSRLNALVEANQRIDDLPALSPALRAEIDEALAAIQIAKAPCDAAEIGRMLGKLALLYPNAKLSAAEARAQLLAYIDLLIDLPAYALRTGFRLCAQQSRFFPSVAEIREQAIFPKAVESWREFRLKAMASRYDREAR